MSDFIRVTPDFAVTAQMTAEDIARAAEEGFATLICNRPDSEGPPITSTNAAAAAAKAKIDFYVLPYSGPPPAQLVEATAALLADSDKPILAYCRSGTRSITIWAHAQAKNRAMTPDAIIAAAAAAGYDLSAQRSALERLAAD